MAALVLGAADAAAQSPPDATPATPATPPQASAATIDVTGRVIDAAGKPVRGATVTVEGTQTTTTTDRKGRFTLQGVALGASIDVDAPGYSTGLAVVTRATLDDIVMLTEAESSETISVQGQPPASSPGAARLDRTETQRVPGTGGDLVRTLTIMPGIVNAEFPTGFGGVVIRGSAPEDSKILVDDFEVPLLYHTIGFRAIVPTEAIDGLEYIPGGFDVQYGRAASGIISLTTRAGADTRSAQAEVSVIDGGVIVQGPASETTHYMIAFRRSMIDLILPYAIPKSLDLSLTTVPRYYDEQLRVDHTLSPHWNLTFSSIGSDDLLELYADKAENADKHFYDRTRFIRLTAAAHFHDGPWTASLATSYLAQQLDFSIGALQFLRVTPNVETTRAEVTHLERDVAGLADLQWRLGAEAAIGRASLDVALPPQPRDGQVPSQFNPNDTSDRFTGIIWTPDQAQWASVTAGLTPGIHVTAGVRVDEFGRGGDVSVQPRGDIKAKLTPTTTLRFSAGAYRRPPENQEEFLFAYLQPERATQLIGGLEYQPSDALRVQGSLYYTDRKRLITRNADGELGNFGTGETYGGELLSTYRADPWFVWLSASLSHSTRVDYPGATQRLFEFDQPLSINAAASWKHGKWTLGGRFELYSGLPTTPVIGAIFDSDINFYNPIYGPADSVRAPMHHQLDLRVDRAFKAGPVQMTWFVDVQNVYLNQSIAGYAYSYDYSQQITFKSLPIIPSIGLRGVL
jgi:outer membrane receptor protein involved in Fe transport